MQRESLATRMAAADGEMLHLRSNCHTRANRISVSAFLQQNHSQPMAYVLGLIAVNLHRGAPIEHKDIQPPI